MRVLVAMTMLLLSCSKLLNTDDKTPDPPAGVVYSSDSSANKVALGIYSRLSSEGLAAGEYSMTFYLGLSADEYTLKRNNPVEHSFYKMYPGLPIILSGRNCTSIFILPMLQ